MFISVTKVTLVCCTAATLADQLPYPLQLFYLSPNNVGIIPPYQVASSYMAVEKTTGGENSSEVHIKQTSGEEEVIEGETSQFHSQDHRGRALFGYTTPDQARIESRNEDGTVRGSYSYLDAWGNAVKVRAESLYTCTSMHQIRQPPSSIRFSVRYSLTHSLPAI